MLRAAREESPFPLVILDGMMPEMDGFMVAEKIREHAELSGATVMMLSSAMPSGAAARCDALGVASYLMKPVSQSELLDAILIAIGNTNIASEPLEEPFIVKSQTSLRILLAEDNVINRALATGILEKCGHTLVYAATGREAVEAVERDAFDVILMDVQMPEMDGLEATRKIREMEKGSEWHTPIIAMTAHAMTGDRERCLASGMDDYIAKPLHKAELLALLEKYTAARATVAANHAPLAPPAALAAPKLPIFSREKLLEELDGDEEFLFRLIDLFQENTPRLLETIRECVEERRGSDLARAAHALLSSLGTFGAVEARRLTEELESQGKQENYEHTERTYAALARATAEIHATLSTFAPARA